MQASQTPSAVDQAVKEAAAAFDVWATSDASTRASLLNMLAAGLEASQTELVDIADRETGLGKARLTGEVARTSFQLRGFADQVTAGRAFAFTDDPAIPGAPPVGHPHLMRTRVPLGPVAMFAASNFPFAFSVLGGDTASALAAGCPVVVKPHPGHPELSRRVFQIAVSAVESLKLPKGLIGIVDGSTIEAGVELIRHPLIAAAAFTGSVRGGLALQAEANARPKPIPFFGELGSINPVVVLPNALEGQGQELARTLAQSITNGAGQFCTSPGVIVAFAGEAADRFVATLSSELGAIKPHAMLTPAIRSGFESGVKRVASREGVKPILADAADGGASPRPFLARTDASTFVADHALQEEVFGPAALVVDVTSIDEASDVLDAVGGSLTVTIWGADAETPENVRLVRHATRAAGRVLFAGVPTGVAVTEGQHHGGPFPSSTQPSSTSVGYAAMDRFLRAVALQDAPAWLIARNGRPA